MTHRGFLVKLKNKFFSSIIINCLISRVDASLIWHYIFSALPFFFYWGKFCSFLVNYGFLNWIVIVPAIRIYTVDFITIRILFIKHFPIFAILNSASAALSQLFRDMVKVLHVTKLHTLTVLHDFAIASPCQGR